jgi:hypothetical protein
VLHKSRRRDPRAWDYGRWWIELHDGTEIGYADGWAGLTLEQVETWLLNREADGAPTPMTGKQALELLSAELAS